MCYSHFAIELFILNSISIEFVRSSVFNLIFQIRFLYIFFFRLWGQIITDHFCIVWRKYKKPGVFSSFVHASDESSGKRDKRFVRPRFWSVIRILKKKIGMCSNNARIYILFVSFFLCVCLSLPNRLCSFIPVLNTKRQMPKTKISQFGEIIRVWMCACIDATFNW